MGDIDIVISQLEGLTETDWQRYHSDSEVTNIAISAMELLKDYKKSQLCHDLLVASADEIYSELKEQYKRFNISLRCSKDNQLDISKRGQLTEYEQGMLDGLQKALDIIASGEF